VDEKTEERAREIAAERDEIKFWCDLGHFGLCLTAVIKLWNARRTLQEPRNMV
jgi:hypothetical protein